MAAWSWYGPIGPLDRVSVTRATPSAMASVFQSVRSCSSSGTSDPSGAGAGRAAGVGQQHEGQQPGHLAVAGDQPVELAGQPDGLGRQLGPHQLRPRRGRVALVEDEVEHMEHDAEPLRLLSRRRQVEAWLRPP